MTGMVAADVAGIPVLINVPFSWNGFRAYGETLHSYAGGPLRITAALAEQFFPFYYICSASPANKK